MLNDCEDEDTSKGKSEEIECEISTKDRLNMSNHQTPNSIFSIVTVVLTIRNQLFD